MPAKYVLGSTRSLLLKAATLLLTFALTLSFFSGANLQAAAKAGDEVEILTSTGYNVRSEASASSTYLGNISSGYTFKVLEVVTGTAHTYGNQWYKFSYSGKDGYIIVNDDPLKQKVTPAVTSPALAKAGDQVEVVSSFGYTVRSEANSTSSSRGAISSGYKFTVLSVVTGETHT